MRWPRPCRRPARSRSPAAARSIFPPSCAATWAACYVNEVQNNPFQPDVSYRGYTASPLLGTPQGLSVYLDGMRLNQPFGDVVSWDLIPRMAIASLTLMPGSNPLFGLNTLGGALALQTKDGKTSPGTAVEARLGSRSTPRRGSRTWRQQCAGLALVRDGQPFQGRGLARRFAVRRAPGVWQAGLERCAHRYRRHRGPRGQCADGQRLAGTAPAGARLPQRLHQAGLDAKTGRPC